MHCDNSKRNVKNADYFRPSIWLGEKAFNYRSEMIEMTVLVNPEPERLYDLH